MIYLPVEAQNTNENATRWQKQKSREV